MPKASTIQLLRFPFSFFLMPVYWFALSQVISIDWWHAFLVFVILHLLVYPASNGYNSYMDRDEGSIGGVANPMVPTVELFRISLLMDIAAVMLASLISNWTAIAIAAYIAASRAYSFRGIRLKKYPLLGYATVIVFQGAVTFWIVYQAASENKTLNLPVVPMIVSSLLVGGFYPLTQVYQHEADRKDGVKTISMLLGYRGTFLFCAAVYSVAFGLLTFYLAFTLQYRNLYVIGIAMLPVLVFFGRWALSVWKDPAAADFRNTMRMNLIASVCTNVAFIIALINNR